jgi:hypothetical protein
MICDADVCSAFQASLFCGPAVAGARGRDKGREPLTKEALDADLDAWRMKDKKFGGDSLDPDMDKEEEPSKQGLSGYLSSCCVVVSMTLGFLLLQVFSVCDVYCVQQMGMRYWRLHQLWKVMILLK